ncbi:MAG: PDDEXK nuclease domain-containing protein [Alphaproteobacteria bacterium]
MTLDKSYKNYIEVLKREIVTARIKASLSVNKELIILYWKIGTHILTMQEKEGWGAKVIEQVSGDLLREFPEMRGLSSRNLKYMRAFSSRWQNFEFVQEVLAQITWYHNIAILEKSNEEEQLWYITKTIENGWSRNVLVHQIESNLYGRQGNAVTNFKDTLPSPQSDLSHELIKSPYNLEFLNISEEILEKDLEQALIGNIRDFLLELGKGFSFVGNQYHIELEGEDYYIDLLFYHLKLRCYVIIELKTGKFLPEHAGKMNFYLNLVDHQLRHTEDNPSIGIILCKDKRNITVKYSLDGLKRPLGVSEYKLNKELEKKIKESLPDEKELKKELGEESGELKKNIGFS